MSELDRERRAWELLQWVPFSLPTAFDEDLALQGYYTKLQKQRSDAALDQWEKDHPATTSEELAAFRELETRGIYSQRQFFSPHKAKNGYYSSRLKTLTEKARRPDRAPRSSAGHRRSRRRRGLA